MSWTLNLTKVSRADLAQALDSATYYGNDDVETEKAEQIAAAKTAILHIARSGALGDDTLYNISAYGHANSEHKPQQGWANDAVSVSVSQSL